MSEVARPNLSDALTARLLDLIRTQGLEPGDRLPAARALAERFAVATPTVREALRRLQATGAIEIRHGSGVYVAEALDRLVLGNPNAPAVIGDRLLQLLDARLLIEPHLAELAATHHDPQHQQRLVRTLSAAERHLSGDDAALHKSNMAFHRAVAAASGNSVLAEIMDSLVVIHSGEQRVILRLYDDRKRDYDEHALVLGAIIEGRAKEARDLMFNHLSDVKKVVAERTVLDQL